MGGPRPWEDDTRATHLATLLLLAAGSAHAQDQATIQELENRLAEALNADDGEAAAALYAEDGALVPPGLEPVEGRDAIAEFRTGASEGMGPISLTTESVTPLGEGHAQEIGSYRMTPAGGGEEATGRYVIVWERVADDWLIKTDIWN